MSQASNAATDNSPDPRLAGLFELSGINETDVDSTEHLDAGEVDTSYKNKKPTYL